jgi:hypothetical protein
MPDSHHSQSSRAAIVACGLLLGTALASAACGTADETPANAPAFTTVVDTVGDTVVVRTTGDIAPAQELQLVETWRIGDPDGDETTSFGWVHSMALNPQDELYVFESTSPQFRHYASDGTLIQVISGKGSGPGEYQRSNGVAVLADGRVALWDAGSSRINLYAADGTYLTLWRPPVASFGTSNQSLLALNDGRLSVRAYVRDTTLTREALGRNAWFIYDTTGTVTDTILEPFFGDPPINLISRRDGNTNSMGVPFLPRPMAAMVPSGRVAGSSGAEYVVHTTHNDQLYRIERSAPSIPVPDAERTQRREQVLYNMRRNDPAWTWNGPDIPTQKPPITGIATTLDGQLLVSVSTPSETFNPDPPRQVEGEVPPPIVSYRSPTAFELFAPDGKLRGRFTLPMGARIHALRGDDAWGTVTDSLDVPYLVRWRLQQPTVAP